VTGHLWIYGVIGDKPKGVTEKYYSFEDFRKELDPKASDYVVHIMSPGGDVYQGLAMFNALKNTGKKIKVQIEGLCASIATLVAGAASPGELAIQENSHYMIHQPSFPSYGGTADQLRTGAEQLDQIRALLVSTYQKRTKLPDDQLWAMSSKDNWMLPEKAKELGFVDEVVSAQKAVAFANFNEMEDKQTIMGAIEALGKKMVALFNPPKNMTATLEDGKVIQVDSEDGDWTGKSATYEDGSQLAPGTYTLADGSTFTVGEDGLIGAPAVEAKIEEPANTEDMDLKAKLEAAEARIKELESALGTQSEAAAQAEDRAAKAENRANVDMKKLQEELNAIKSAVAGDPAPPKMGVKTPVATGGKPAPVDPMQAWYEKTILKVRNTD
jgi:ATP-dependent protease ClpP protease subunit